MYYFQFDFSYFRSRKLNVFRFLLHRYIRLTPVVGATIFFMLTLQRYFGDGPFNKYLINEYTKNCYKYWWSALLHIQNIVNPNDMCLDHIWYLSADFQLFLFSPLMGILLWKYGTAILKVFPLFIFSSVFFIFVISYENDYKVNYEQRWTAPESLYRHVHFSFYGHLTSYFFGMMTSYVVQRKPEVVIKVKRYFSSTLLWFISIGILISTIAAHFPFYSTKFHPSTIANATFLSTIHVGWSISLSWTILACHCGEGCVINRILTLQLWKPLARLGLSMCVTHVSVTLAVFGTLHQPDQFNELLNAHHFLGDLGISFGFALLAYFTFEASFLAIEKSFYEKN